MAYTAVKGGGEAILAAEALIRQMPVEATEPMLEIRQLLHQLRPAIDEVMGEGGLYAPELAALAYKQCEGDRFEASFTLRAYRSTLPRLGYSLPAHSEQMTVDRRISSTFRDVPGGQLLGRTRDYTQRLLDFSLLQPDQPNGNGTTVTNGYNSSHASDGRTSRLLAFSPPRLASSLTASTGHFPKVAEVMRTMGIMTPKPEGKGEVEPDDITRESMRFPVSRSAWLQALARGESGAIVCLAYSGMRGYGGGDHGTIAELRVGDLPLHVTHPLTGKPYTVGRYRVTEVEMTGKSGKTDTKGQQPAPGYGLSYGMVFGQNERKAIAMALLDSSLQQKADSEGNPPPANDQEMVLYHVDGIESYAFVEHLKLPHFVTFGSSLQILLDQRREGNNVSPPPGADGPG